jgi:uncharacterized membrane protein YphA (DoxX/SURF4 family)
MSSSKPTDWEKRLRDLEKDIYDSTQPTLPVRPFNPDADSPELLNRVMAWYQGLTSPAKIAVAIGGTVLALMVLNGVLKLVASLIAIAIMGVVLYALYRAFVVSKTEKDS